MSWPRLRSVGRKNTTTSTATGPLEMTALRDNWEELARSIPMRSILWRQRPWEAEEFFATGREQVDRSMTTLSDLGIRPAGRALDFGCGIGRLTQALANQFDEVVGVDVAAPMIEQAKNYNRFGERCRYLVNATDDLRQFENASFDFVFSLIVLQHVAKPLAMRYISEFVRVLRPGGVAMFQAPSEIVSTLPLAPSAIRAELELIEPPLEGLENLPSASIVSLQIRSRVRGRRSHSASTLQPRRTSPPRSLCPASLDLTFSSSTSIRSATAGLPSTGHGPWRSRFR